MGELTITREEATTWLDLYGRAWETRDSDLIVSLFVPDGLYRETRFAPPFRGLDNIRAYWNTDVVARQRDIAFSSTLWGVNGALAYAHWQCGFQDLKKGGRRQVDGVFRLTFAERASRHVLCGVLDEWWNITAPEP